MTPKSRDVRRLGKKKKMEKGKKTRNMKDKSVRRPDWIWGAGRENFERCKGRVGKRHE